MTPGESLMPLLQDIASGQGVKETMESLNKLGDEGHKSIPMNLVMADN
jgi:hypothetical protein